MNIRIKLLKIKEIGNGTLKILHKTRFVSGNLNVQMMFNKYKGKQQYIFILHIDQQCTKIILIRS